MQELFAKLYEQFKNMNNSKIRKKYFLNLARLPCARSVAGNSPLSRHLHCEQCEN